MTHRRNSTEPRDAATTTPESPPLHRPRTAPPPPPSARRARVAAGSSPPTQPTLPSTIKLRRPPQEDGLDAVVAGLLGRAKRQTRHPQLPIVEPTPPLDLTPEGTGQNTAAQYMALHHTSSDSYQVPSVAPARWPWVVLAFVAGAAVATAIALALVT